MKNFVSPMIALLAVGFALVLVLQPEKTKPIVPGPLEQSLNNLCPAGYTVDLLASGEFKISCTSVVEMNKQLRSFDENENNFNRVDSPSWNDKSSSPAALPEIHK